MHLQLLALIACALTAGCTSHAAPLPPVVLRVAAVNNGCTALLDASWVPQEELLAAARDWRGRNVVLKGVTDEPYKCAGPAVFTLQRAGVKRVGFISEPPKE
jgi:hypothetical protein